MRLGPLTISLRKSSEVAQETPNLHQRVHRLEMALLQFGERFDALQGAHMKLRNQFHGSKGGRPVSNSETPISQIPRGDKAALRRALGVVPGKPFAHQE